MKGRAREKERERVKGGVTKRKIRGHWRVGGQEINGRDIKELGRKKAANNETESEKTKAQQVPVTHGLLRLCSKNQ